jgi:hypothetical protein
VKASKPAPVATAEQAAAPEQPASVSLEVLVAQWPAILQEVISRRKVTGMVMTDTAPLSITADGLLAVGFPTEGALKNFPQAPNPEILQDAIKKVLSIHVRIDPILEPSLKGRATKASATVQADAVKEVEDSVNTPTVSSIDLVAGIFGGEVISDSSHQS